MDKEEATANSAQRDLTRKLTAIFSADVKGYSRLMGDDEAATVRTITAYREVMTALIEQHYGRVVDSPGDNMLAEFASVVDAVQGAIAIQRELTSRNAELPEQRRMAFRIGINVGDVITDDGRLYGDGVNIAARIEGLADPGGICISEAAYTQIENKLALEYEEYGEHAVKNIAKPVRVYKVVLEAETAASPPSSEQSPSSPAAQPVPSRRWLRTVLAVVAVLVVGAGILVWRDFLSLSSPLQESLPAEDTSALPLPNKPSIAVLPFTNMSGDPEQEYFSDGLTDTLITDLSKLSGLFVIARNSVFTYKGKAVKVEDVSKDLGVRYVVEGSVQKRGDRLRINVQLIDATTGGHIWADRYDRDMQDVFALQDKLTQRIVTTLQLRFERGVLVGRRGTNNLEAYDHYLRGLASFFRGTKAANLQARQLWEHAVALDPEYAEAYAWLAVTHWVASWFQWSQDKQELDRAFELAQRALSLNDTLPVAYRALAWVYVLKKQHDQAIAAAERAVAFDPNCAECYETLAQMLTFAGRAPEAIALVQQAMRLNPHYQAITLNTLGWVYLAARRYEEAIGPLKQALSRNPDFTPPHVNLAIIYGELGREEEARAEVVEIARLSPNYSVETLRQVLAHKDRAHVERNLAALRKAGLKER